MNFNCFKFTCFIDMLEGLLAYKKSKNPLFSMRSWAKFLGYSYPSYLYQCVNRERSANVELLRKILSKETFTSVEREYITFLFLKHCCKDVESLDISRLEGTFSEFKEESAG